MIDAFFLIYALCYCKAMYVFCQNSPPSNLLCRVAVVLVAFSESRVRAIIVRVLHRQQLFISLGGF